MKQRKPSRPDLHDWDARATEALDAARLLPVGPARIEALKKAGVLRSAADARGFFVPKQERPEKT
ncbi:MAG: hypothetical protein JWQ94_2249 [Tardiphaga sp.]|nr:hypothetical protein [Tardiphaga sp.]